MATTEEFRNWLANRKYYNRLSESRREQVRANTIKAELLGLGFAPLDPDKLRDIDVPTLLINGEESPNVFHCFLDRIEELISDTERIQIANGPHIMQEDNPETFNSEVIKFLSYAQNLSFQGNSGGLGIFPATQSVSSSNVDR